MLVNSISSIYKSTYQYVQKSTCRYASLVLPFQRQVQSFLRYLTFHLNLFIDLIIFLPFPKKTMVFIHVCRKSVLKTLWEKNKLLIRAIYPFPTVFLTILENSLPFLSNLKLSSANSFSLVEFSICRLGKS